MVPSTPPRRPSRRRGDHHARGGGASGVGGGCAAAAACGGARLARIVAQKAAAIGTGGIRVFQQGGRRGRSFSCERWTPRRGWRTSGSSTSSRRLTAAKAQETFWCGYVVGCGADKASAEQVRQTISAHVGQRWWSRGAGIGGGRRRDEPRGFGAVDGPGQIERERLNVSVINATSSEDSAAIGRSITTDTVNRLTVPSLRAIR